VRGEQTGKRATLAGSLSWLLVNAPKPPQFLRLQPAHLPQILHWGTRVSWESRSTSCILECWIDLHEGGPRWNDAELQSARRGRRVTCRLSHVRESKEQYGFRSSKTSPFVPIFIVSPPVYSHTAFLDDFFWRSFPYTQVEATQPWHTCGESSPLSKDTSRVCAQKAPASSGVCQTLVVCERSHREMKGEEMLWRQARNLFYYRNASPLRVFRTYGQCRG
jgi:hypothetical protein